MEGKATLVKAYNHLDNILHSLCKGNIIVINYDWLDAKSKGILKESLILCVNDMKQTEAYQFDSTIKGNVMKLLTSNSTSIVEINEDKIGKACYNILTCRFARTLEQRTRELSRMLVGAEVHY